MFFKLSPFRALCVVTFSLLGFSAILFKMTNYDVRIQKSSDGQKPHLNPQKHITPDGVYPLPNRPVYQNNWKNDSVIPKRFFLQKQGVSSHNYKWILNPFRTCVSQSSKLINKKMEDIFLLVMIASASWEFERRNIIRKTWASVQYPFEKNVIYIFFVGNDRKSNLRLQQEFDKYGDIVMGDFMETYKNLTIKTQGQLKWATYFCPNARYVMHVDDDVFANIKELVKHLLNEKEDRCLHCGKVFMPKVRREGKWAMAISEYEGKQYPLSCVGWCFIMTQEAANQLYYISLDTPLIHLEDVTFTGILREKIGNLKLRKIPHGEALCKHLGWPKDLPTNEKLIYQWESLSNSSA